MAEPQHAAVASEPQAEPKPAAPPGQGKKQGKKVAAKASKKTTAKAQAKASGKSPALPAQAKAQAKVALKTKVNAMGAMPSGQGAPSTAAPKKSPSAAGKESSGHVFFSCLFLNLTPRDLVPRVASLR